MSQIKLVIFDMDGLLVDTERPSYLSMKEILGKKGYDFPLDYYRELIGLSGGKANTVLQELYGEDFRYELYSEECHRRFDEILEEEGVLVKPGAEKLLDALEEKGIKKCIASSSTRETIKHHMESTGLAGRFDFYVSGHEVKNGKPHPDIFLEACRRAGETPETAIVLEDSLNGLKAAHGAGIPCTMVPDLIPANDEMKEKALAIITDLEQVIGMIGD